jgi:hypothetical protein
MVTIPPINGASHSSDDGDDLNTALKELLTDIFTEMQKPAKDIDRNLVADRHAQATRLLMLNAVSKTRISDGVLLTIPSVLRPHLLSLFLMTFKITRQ